MKKIFIPIIVALLFSCEENKRLLYDETKHDIYFSLVTDTRDSVFMSLLLADEILTSHIDVKLLGKNLTTPEKFKLEVVAEKTDAIEGKHYQKLPEYYEFPVDTFLYQMPVNLIKGDTKLEETPVTLCVRLVSIGDLGIAYKNRAEIRIIIADMLKAPEGDGYYGDMTAFKKLFGEYSRKKHMMIIELVGHDFWDGNYGSYGGNSGIYWEISYYLPYARQLYKIITENEIRDENGNIIQGWMVP